jgi:hypothetical protein
LKGSKDNSGDIWEQPTSNNNCEDHGGTDEEEQQNAAI